MNEEFRAFKDQIRHILESNRYMCQCGEVKCNQILEKVEVMDLLSIDTVAFEVNKLIEKFQFNLETWRKELCNALGQLQLAQAKERNCKHKFNLSLKKDDDIQDTNVDFSKSDSEVEEIYSRQASSNETDEKNNYPKASDSDSEKTIPYYNEDKIKLQNDSIHIDDAEKSSENKQSSRCNSESASFDFDDDLDLMKVKDADMKLEIEKNRQENAELLDLLNKITDDGDSPRSDKMVFKPDVSDEDCEAILKHLEEEMSDSESNADSSDLDWEPSDFESSDCNPENNSERSSDDESEDTSRTTTESESQPEQQEPELKNFSISLHKIDHFSDREIDRLCDLENINKRKCKELMRKSKKRRSKRPRLLSTTSEESLQSCSTPDIELQTKEPSPIPCISSPVTNDDFVELLLNRMNDSSAVYDSESEIENKEGKTEKGVKKKAIKDDNKIIDNEERSDGDNDDSTKSKASSSWKNDLLLRDKLWSSSEDESKSNSDTEKKKRRSVVSNARETPAKEENKEEPTVISSSDSDSDIDDCTLIEDLGSGAAEDVSSSRGRRNIRAIMSDEELDAATRRAKQEEEARIRRLEEHSQTMEMIQSQHDEFVLDANVITGIPSVTVDPGLAKVLKPHQKGGVQFMWEACYESVQVLKTKPGTGCILAHCMGLGKTRQVITLLHTLFSHPVTQTRHVVVICPVSTVSNWRNEFCLVFADATKKTSIRRKFLIQEDIFEKCRQVLRWRQEGGIIVMGYEAFQSLINERTKRQPKIDLTPEQRTELRKALIDPGPDLIVCDEAHLLKNAETLRNKALMRVKTKRRIALTGTPLQNNLTEYYCMVQFVKPHLLGTFKEYKNRFANPIENGQYFDSTLEDIKMMKKRTHVLTKLLKRTLDRVESSVLTSCLPEIIDYTIYISLQTLQMDLYRKYIAMVTRQGEGNLTRTGFFQDFRITNFITLHPYVLHLYYMEKKKPKKIKEKETPKDNFVQIEKMASRVADDWYNNLYPDDVSNNIQYSAKMKIMMAVVDEAVQNNDKVLIFAHHLAELDVVEHFLKVLGTPSLPRWRPNIDYYRMDGQLRPDKRSDLCNNFNNDRTVKVFLLSHRVGGLGLNLTSANRVILIGSHYNPSHDSQSIYRMYRYGQHKKCFVYRLLSVGTMEQKVYQKCVVKLSVAGTVVDKLHIDRHYNSFDLQQMYQINFADYAQRPIPNVPKDKLLANLLQNSEDIHSYIEHNALLENRPDEELDDNDKKMAWEEFNNEQMIAKTNVGPMVFNPTYAHMRNPAQRPVAPFNGTSLHATPSASGAFPVTYTGDVRPGVSTSGMRPVVPSDGMRPFAVGAPSTSGLVRHPPPPKKINIVPRRHVPPPRPRGPPPPLKNRTAWNKYMVEPQPVTGGYSSALKNFAKALNLSYNKPSGEEGEEFNYALNRVI